MVSQAFWQFRCPECGLGDTEHGHLLTAQELYCVVCLEEDGRYVHLYRWEVLEEASSPPSVPSARAPD